MGGLLKRIQQSDTPLSGENREYTVAITTRHYTDST